MTPYFLFQIESHSFLIETHRLVEILQTYEIYDIPRSPKHILGFTAFRGSIAVLINLQSLLKVSPPTPKSRLIIFEYEHHNVGIIVDFVDMAHPLVSASTDLKHPLQTFLRQSYLHNDQIVRVLDLDALIKAL
ncbi:MAG: chemotaxis protein CheW [Myxococcota bacterium]|nr:chemotaxis protein CheW [Myxococcota bacterium]